MSKKSLICIAASELQAAGIVDRLKDEGFSTNDISVLFSAKTRTRAFAQEKSTKAPEGADRKSVV